jgi:hypothetical protein
MKNNEILECRRGNRVAEVSSIGVEGSRLPKSIFSEQRRANSSGYLNTMARMRARRAASDRSQTNRRPKLNRRKSEANPRDARLREAGIRTPAQLNNQRGPDTTLDTETKTTLATEAGKRI